MILLFTMNDLCGNAAARDFACAISGVVLADQASPSWERCILPREGKRIQAVG